MAVHGATDETDDARAASSGVSAADNEEGQRVEVWLDGNPTSAGTAWLAWSDDTLVLGWGPDRDAAMDDYRDKCREQCDRLVELGPAHVSPSLWATLPALQEALGVSADG